MEFINFVMALSPIVVVLVGILAFHQSAKKVAPVALVWTLILAFTYFNVTGATFKENVATYDPLVWKGLKEGCARPVAFGCKPIREAAGLIAGDGKDILRFGKANAGGQNRVLGHGKVACRLQRACNGKRAASRKKGKREQKPRQILR